MEETPTIRERLDAGARLAYGAERAAALTSALDRLAVAIDAVTAFAAGGEREPFPTGPGTRERQP